MGSWANAHNTKNEAGMTSKNHFWLDGDAKDAAHKIAVMLGGHKEGPFSIGAAITRWAKLEVLLDYADVHVGIDEDLAIHAVVLGGPLEYLELRGTIDEVLARARAYRDALTKRP